MAALGDMLESLDIVIKSKDNAKFAFRRVSSFLNPTAAQPAASGCRALEAALRGLMALIETEDDATLVLERISGMIVSLAASSATWKESDSY